MTIDWQTFFADGRNEKETNLNFDSFSLRLYPESPDELDYNSSTSETGRYTDHFSTLNYCSAENECGEVLAYIHVEDYESGKCRRTVDFFCDEIKKAAAETPEIIPVLQDFREFLLKNGFEIGGSLPK